jgi:hypothetical protein
LDEERSGMCRGCGASLRRDDGDGSSSSTNADEIPPHNTFRPTSQNNNNTSPNGNYLVLINCLTYLILSILQFENK